MKGIISAKDFVNIRFDTPTPKKKMKKYSIKLPVMIHENDQKKYSKKQILHFNKLGAAGVIDQVVLSEMDRNEIIYGAKATNKHLAKQKFLQRHTEDFDCFSL